MPLAVLILTSMLGGTNTSQPATTRPTVESRLPREISVSEWNFKFSVPAEFARTTIDPAEDRHGLLKDFLILIDAAPYHGRAPAPIPPDGRPPMIAIKLLDPLESSVFLLEAKEEWRTTIGPHAVYKFPAYPGPFGEASHCYLVPTEGKRAFLIVAHRNHLRDDHTWGEVTHYDWVIERIIATMAPAQ
jgi:hypothetical protein